MSERNMDRTKQVKANVAAFIRDASTGGAYAYTGERLSSRLALKRIVDAMIAMYPPTGRRLLDLGCGDGQYSLDFFRRGGGQFLLGIDPAEPAVKAAQKRFAEAGLADRARFQVGNIYDLSVEEHFDCITLTGVLHHLPDAAAALRTVAPLTDNILIMEPNGWNPVVKLLEKLSRYHREHEEQSFRFRSIRGWLEAAGFTAIRCELVNLVPMMCPDWLAGICKFLEPAVEAAPGLRDIACGQYVILASKSDSGGKTHEL
jgi:SAM-dependent methyltransferase